MQVLNGMNGSDGIVSGKFQVGDRVHRLKEDVDRHGSIVELKGDRCRVLWDAVDPEPGRTASNYHAAKRTWVNQKFLAKVHQ